MKTFNLCIVLLCISTFAFAQTRVDIGEIYGARLEKQQIRKFIESMRRVYSMHLNLMTILWK